MNLDRRVAENTCACTTYIIKCALWGATSIRRPIVREDDAGLM